MAQSPAMTAIPRRSGALVALVAALLVAACGSTTPTPSTSTPAPTAVATPAPTGGASPSAAPSATPGGSPSALTCDANAPAGSPAAQDPSDPNAAIYDAIEQQVRDIRGLPESTPVERDVFDTAELCAYFRESFRKDNPPELIRGTELLYRELGLIPEDASLEQLYLDLLTSQVAGLYDDDAKKMYVVSKSDQAGPLEKFVYAHEYDHAITDQAFGLRKTVGEATDQSDRSLARSALVEGDATLLMSIWAQGNLTPAELLEAAGAADPASQEVLNRMPAILKDPLGFPYTGGLQLALGAFTSGGGYGGVDELYRNPPDSTEQVIHPEKLASREAPVPVAFPEDLASRLGDGWKVSLQDTFGELLLEIILRDHGASGTADAAAGWGGDRVALIEGPSGETAVVLDSAWDTEADADEFAAALEATRAELAAAGKQAQILRPDPSRVVLVSAESPDTLGRVANVLGLAG
jgi:hypothetical protein